LKCLTRSGSTPVLFQFFLVELSPSEDEAELAAAQVAVDHLEIVDADLRFSFSMAGMEMREAMVVEEHRDRDPIEAANRWHEPHHGVGIGGSFISDFGPGFVP
jgi:hypothetical protein